jgi:hypothetical protein
LTEARSTELGAVRLAELRVGEMLAEGGEGRVYELPLQPHLVLKAFRRPASREFLEDLVAWPAGLGDGELAGRVRAAASWPAAVVLDEFGSAAGLLLPRSPRRFALRHRDGTTRLASLSYLTADPEHRAVAYGLRLPPAVSPERLGLVYALALLLQAFECAEPMVGHGDLSTKNVLWSLQRGPEVFVLDCDNCERYDRQRQPLGPPDRRRAMTPNWDDPAVASGRNPSLVSDRYSLALIFLRVVGAANFPIQARQRDGGAVTVDFAVPPAAFGDGLLGPGAAVWDLCERGLSIADPAGRPAASTWVAALEQVLGKMGADSVLQDVHAGQGGADSAGRAALSLARAPGVAGPGPDPGPGSGPGTGPSPGITDPTLADPTLPAPAPRDVEIHPVLGAARSTPKWSMIVAEGTRPVAWRRPQGPGTTSTVAATGVSPAAVPGGSAGGPAGSALAGQPSPVLPQILAFIRQAVRLWADMHRRAGRALVGRQPGERVRKVAFCAAVDLFLAIVTLFVVAMLVSPLLGI